MNIERLNQNERLEARNKAIKAVQKLAGERPTRSAFKNTQLGKYPSWLIVAVIVLCGVLLIAAFIPSSIRLYDVGARTFGDGIQHNDSMIAAGISAILLAEVGAVLFTLAFAVLEGRASRWILAVSAISTAAIALVGNYQVALMGKETTPFTWLEALMPPALTLSTAFILKEFALDAVRNRHAENVAYAESLADFEQAFNNPEAHPRFIQAYANALRDAIKAKNNQGRGKSERLAYLQGLPAAYWRRLVYAEIKADDWFDLATVEEALEEMNASEPVDTERVERVEAVGNEHLALPGPMPLMPAYNAVVLDTPTRPKPFIERVQEPPVGKVVAQNEQPTSVVDEQLPTLIKEARQKFDNKTEQVAFIIDRGGYRQMVYRDFIDMLKEAGLSVSLGTLNKAHTLLNRQ